MPMFRLKPMIYDTLASYYDALVKDEEATLSWVHWIESFQKPYSMLELACGSAEITPGFIPSRISDDGPGSQSGND